MYILSNINSYSGTLGTSYRERPHLFGLDDLAGAALVGSGLSAVSSLFGLGSSSSNTSKTNAANLQQVRETNEMNYKIAQENNAFNERQFDKQIQYNWDMWNAQKRNDWDMWNATNNYNSAAAQVQRYADAGVNPQMAMTSQGSGTAQSVGSSSGNSVTPPTATPVQMQASRMENNSANIIQGFQSLGNAAADAAMKAAQTHNIDAQTVLGKIQAKYAVSQILADIALKKSQTKNYDSIKDLNQIMFDLKKSTFSDDVSLAHWNNLNSEQQNLYTRAQQNFINMQTSLLGKEYENWDNKFKAEMALIGAQVAQALASGRLSDSQAESEVVRRGLMAAEAHHYDVSANQIARLTPFLVGEHSWQAQTNKWLSEQYRLSTPHPEMEWYSRYAHGVFGPLKGLLNIGFRP
jgi:hypothetical protein